MFRQLTIAVSELKKLPFFDFLELIKKSLYRNQGILVYSLRISDTNQQAEEGPGGIEIRKGDVLELEEANPSVGPKPWEFRCHRYDGVKDFFIAYNNDGIQHISWIYYGGNPNRILRLGVGDAEIKYSLTMPPYRGRGLFPNVLKATVRFLGRQGCRRAFICAQKENFSSIKAIQKVGFQCVGKAHLRKLMGLQISRRLNTSGM